ncbi:1603_t:CDS:2 [Ambispora gerdemannii]|uniref:1603_t:CDS:1 n=1 Tax=Ambispora gerdemannii TaxID=144530 RepID=A0A9N9ALD2_9GLOM|nr:1603_t:CDS:2 [Ambispora gerdemannii]
MVVLSQRIIEKLKCPVLVTTIYILGNLSTWEEYYRRQNLHATIDECYNSLDEISAYFFGFFMKINYRTGSTPRPQFAKLPVRTHVARRHVAHEAVDFEKYPMLKNYCRTLLAMQELHIEEDSQRAQDSFVMLEWSVVNFEIFADAGWQGERKPATISIPQIELKLLSPIFEQHFDCRIRSVTAMLRSLENKGKIGNSSVFNSWVDWLWNQSKIYYKIDALTCIPVISAVILYIPTPCCGLGSEPSENHIKAELWTSILSNTFSLHNPKFVPIWEFHNLIPGDGGRGSAKSGFSAIGRFEVHKDDVVIVAEATHEFNRMHYPSDEEINKMCLHIGLVNGASIRLGKLMPVFDQQQSTLIYVYDDEVLSFNLQTKDEEANIESALQLVTYLRETVCMDGMRIRSLLNRYPAKFNYDLKAALPKLPNEAVISRKSDTKFTPRSKRQRYTLMTADLSY